VSHPYPAVKRLGYGLVEVTIRVRGRLYTGGACFSDVDAATRRAKLKAAHDLSGTRGR
jgi:hypothetical protein